MGYRSFILTLVPAIAAVAAHAAPTDPIRLELNALENAEGHCRISFVIENNGNAPLETLQLELALFNRDGIVQRLLAADMGPLRAAKTTVRSFTIDGSCDGVGSLLLNDVTACAPGDANACLERLALSSRVNDVRFYK